MQQYLDFMQYVLDKGTVKQDRTKTGTISVFGEQLKFDLDPFPIITTKKINWSVVVSELMWMLNGQTNVKWLNERGVKIWDKWADENGDLGPVYGKQLRDFGGVDQLTTTIENIRKNPYSRRHVISYWNPPELDKMKLEPCHYTHQYYVRDGFLDIMVGIRSNDIFIGMPYNISEYALLNYLVCLWTNTGLKPGRLIYNIGDAHIYLNHLEQVNLQLVREPYPLPKLAMNLGLTDEPTPDSIKLINYQHHPFIKAEVAV